MSKLGKDRATSRKASWTIACADWLLVVFLPKGFITNLRIRRSEYSIKSSKTCPHDPVYTTMYFQGKSYSGELVMAPNFQNELPCLLIVLHQ